MNHKEFRKKNREKRKVFNLYMLLIMFALAVSIVMLVNNINFGFDNIFFLLGFYFLLSIIFDKSVLNWILKFFKKTKNNTQNDN
jgi:hypothetical protein